MNEVSTPSAIDLATTLAEALPLISSSGPWSASEVAELFLRLGFAEELSGMSQNPDTETVYMEIGGRHNSNGDQYARDAISKPWHDMTDEIHELNWSYLADIRDESIKAAFQACHEGRGLLAPLRQALEARMEELDDSFNESEFIDAVADEVLSQARDDGLDAVFELEPALRGSCVATLNQDFSFERGSFEHVEGPMVPCWNTPKHARDWAQGLSFLNIHPADFANAARSKALAAIEDDDVLVQWGAQTPSDKARLRSDVRQSLAAQGLSRRVGRDPARWVGGLAQLAKAWSRPGWSLPKDGAAPAVSVGELVDILSSESGSVEFEFSFGADANELQEHSELIDRFGAQSPICAQALAKKTFVISDATLYVSGNEVAFAGPIPASIDSLCFEDSSESCGGFEPCMGPDRIMACLADSLSYRLRHSPSSPSAKALHMRDIARDCTKLALNAPIAIEWALDKAGALAELDPDCLDALRQGQHEGHVQAVAHDARVGRKNTTKTSKVSIDDFDIRHGGLMGAPWRSQVGPGLATAKDSLGNSLAHKACATLDSELLRQALADRPELATMSNLGGATPIDLIHHRDNAKGFIPLALALLEKRPDLANASAASGRSFLDLAVARSAPIADLEKLIVAGCDLGVIDDQGRAPWFHWAHAPHEKLRERLAPAIAHGWDINRPDGHGRTLAHLVSRLESALALLDLGADFSLRDHEGRQGGCSIPAGDFAALETRILTLHAPVGAPSRKSKAL